MALAAACLMATIAAFAALPRVPARNAPVALVFPPWLGRSTAVNLTLSAGYRVLRAGRLNSIIIAAPPSADRLEHGLPTQAWFVLALDGLAGCLDSSSER